MNTEPSAQLHITQLRQHLMDTLSDLRSRTNPMEPDRARAVAQVAGVLVDTAKVEIDYIKATGSDRSGFLETPPVAHVAHLGAHVMTEGLPNGINSITQHRLQG